MIIETLQRIRKLSIDPATHPYIQLQQISRITNELLVSLQARPREAAAEFSGRIIKLLPAGSYGPETLEQIELLAEAFLEGASCHKLQQIGLVIQNHNLLVTQLTRISSILGDQP